MILLLLLLAQDPTAVAREHFQAAEAAEKRGDLELAVSEYLAAYEAKPHPAVLFNIGAVYERLGEPEEAVHYFQRYLDERPDAPDGAAVRARVAALRSRPSIVTALSQPPGARISLDGTPKCSAPCEFRAAAGTHDVAAEFPGREAQRKKVTAEYGKPVEVTFTLRARNGRLVVRANPEGAAITVDGESVGTSPLEIEVTPGRHRVGARAQGFRPRTETVDVPDGESIEVAPELVALGGGNVRILPPPQLTQPHPVEPIKTAHYTYGLLGGPNARHTDNSWGGGFSLGVQSAGEGLDLEMLLLLPVATFQFDLRFYLSTTTVVRPFLVVGAALVGQKSDTMSSSVSDTTPIFYTVNAGAGISIDLGRVALFAEGLANEIVGTDAPERFSVPVLGGLYIRQ